MTNKPLMIITGKEFIGAYKCFDCKEVYIVRGKNRIQVEEELQGQSFRDALKDMLKKG